MSELSPAIVAEIVAACRAGAGDASDALGRAFDVKFTLGEPRGANYAPDTQPVGFDGPGLAVLVTFGGVGLAILAPESSELLPPWYGAPDATGESKLSTLAEELGKALVPESLAADKFIARRVSSLADALAAAGAATNAAAVSIEVTCGDRAGSLTLVWPLAAPTAMFAAPGDEAASEQRVSGPNVTGAGAGKSTKAVGLAHLPHYSRSLLKIRIPVSVQLATKKESVQEVVELVPGSIIKFEKGCDELLQMVIGGQPVAEGEAVKVGDKFGFRVTGMLLPREHFVPAGRPKAG